MSLKLCEMQKKRAGSDIVFDWPTLQLSVASHHEAAEVAGAPPSALLPHRLGRPGEAKRGLGSVSRRCCLVWDKVT